MRVPPTERRRRGGFRLRGWVIALVAVIVVLFLSARGLAGFYTDYLWFDSVGFGDTWRSLLAAKIIPAAIFTTVFFVLMLASLTIADRLAPRTRALGPEDEMIARYQQTVGAYSGRLRIGVSLFFALIAGGSVAGQWQSWVLFTNRVDFGIKDPQFDTDVGFYVFQLPFLTFTFGWLFAALIIVLVVTAVAHYLNGGIRLQTPFQRVTPQVKAHLSVILALMALVKTAQYYLARYELNFSTRGVVEGASKTDVAAQLPALNFLMFVSVIAAALFVWNIWRRGWVLPIVAVGLWAFVSLLVGTIVPAIYQRVRVDPNELAQERPYIQRNIEATRSAFSLDDVEVADFPYATDLTVASLADNERTISNARLWDPGEIRQNFGGLQRFGTFYGFPDADVDRYDFGSGEELVLLSARELNLADLPSQSWVNRHLVYTHGYAAVVARGNASDEDGYPAYALSDIPPTGNPTLALERPELYFGEELDGYSIVDAKQDEYNFTEDGRDRFTRYEGSGGVQVSSPLRRAAFALRFADWNLIVSSQVTSESRIMYLRDIRQRVETAAPFLEYDDDPYPVVVDGRIVWMVDAYTTSDRYPYSQTFSAGTGGLSDPFNYVRNSVKATVDAYDGTVRFYVIDPDDPIVQAYRKAFPELFSDFEDMPDALRDHIRYPEDLFGAQTEVYTAYHMTNPTTFYNRTDLWAISPDPGTGEVTDLNLGSGNLAPTSTTNAPQPAASTGQRIEPIYTQIRLPGQETEQFQILRPFVPVSRGNQLQNLVAFMTASSDPDSYGEMRSFVMPSGQGVFGPAQVNGTIQNTPEISEQFTLLGRQGSKVIQGSLQLIPIEDSLLYIRPVYVTPRNQDNPLNAFRFVIVFYANDAKLGTSVCNALQQFEDFASVPCDQVEGPDLAPTDPEAPDEPEAPAEPETPAPSGSVEELLQQASEAYQLAEQARLAGDLGEYQRLVTEVGRLLQAAVDAGAAPPAPPPTSPPAQAAALAASDRRR